MKSSASFSLRPVSRATTPPSAAQRSLFGASRPLFLLSRALGLACFTVEERAGGETPHTSRRALAYAFCVAGLLLLCCTLFFAWMAFDVYPTYTAKSVLASAVTKTLHFGTALAALAQLSGVRRRHVASALRRVALADRTLLAGDARRVYAATHSLLVLQVTLYFAILVGYFTWDVYITNQFESYGAADWVMYYAMGQIPHAFNFALTLQFVNLLALLTHRFGRINAQLDAVLLRFRESRNSRFWRTLQEELRKCGYGAEDAGEFPAATAREGARMRFRKRGLDAPRHRRSRLDSLPLRPLPPSLPRSSEADCIESRFASLSENENRYRETDSDYESDERCECVYDGWVGYNNRRSWASNRTSATSIESGDCDRVGDVDGDVTDSATRSIRDSESSEMSSEGADTDCDEGVSACGDDAGKATATRETEDEKALVGLHSGGKDPEEDLRRLPEGDNDNDAAYYEAENTRVSEWARRTIDSPDASTVVDIVGLEATVGGQSSAAVGENRATAEKKGARETQSAVDGRRLAAREESKGRKGTETPGRFSAEGSPFGGNHETSEEGSISEIEKHPLNTKSKNSVRCDRDRALSQKCTERKQSAKQLTTETSCQGQAEDKRCDSHLQESIPRQLRGVASDRDVSTTERTEYFGMKRAEGGEGFRADGAESGNVDVQASTGSGGGVKGSISEEGTRSWRKRTGEARGSPAHCRGASARLLEESSSQEKGQTSFKREKGLEHNPGEDMPRIVQASLVDPHQEEQRSNSHSDLDKDSLQGSVRVQNNGKIIIKIRKADTTKTAGDCNTEKSVIDKEDGSLKHANSDRKHTQILNELSRQKIALSVKDTGHSRCSKESLSSQLMQNEKQSSKISPEGCETARDKETEMIRNTQRKSRLSCKEQRVVETERGAGASGAGAARPSSVQESAACASTRAAGEDGSSSTAMRVAASTAIHTTAPVATDADSAVAASANTASFITNTDDATLPANVTTPTAKVATSLACATFVATSETFVAVDTKSATTGIKAESMAVATDPTRTFIVTKTTTTTINSIAARSTDVFATGVVTRDYFDASYKVTDPTRTTSITTTTNATIVTSAPVVSSKTSVKPISVIGTFPSTIFTDSSLTHTTSLVTGRNISSSKPSTTIITTMAISTIPVAETSFMSVSNAATTPPSICTTSPDPWRNLPLVSSDSPLGSDSVQDYHQSKFIATLNPSLVNLLPPISPPRNRSSSAFPTRTSAALNHSSSNTTTSESIYKISPILSAVSTSFSPSTSNNFANNEISTSSSPSIISTHFINSTNSTASVQCINSVTSKSSAPAAHAVTFSAPAPRAQLEWDETDSEACGGTCGGAARLRELRRCHDALSEAARRLAAAFGLPLLLLLAYVFTVTVSCVYYSIAHGVQFYAFWLVANTAQAVAVVTSCHLCAAAAPRAQTLAARALLEGPPPAARAELAHMRRQAGLGPLRFTACGLFNIETGLLLAMAGGIASYTVIILQFECLNAPLLTGS